MSKHTISEAARLVGKHRSTIQKHIREGKLSKVTDNDGNPFIETSELLRVYEGLALTVGKGNRVAADDLQQTTPSSTPKVAELEAALELEKVRRETAETLLRKSETSEADWKDQAYRLSMLLTDQREKKEDQTNSKRFEKFMKKLKSY